MPASSDPEKYSIDEMMERLKNRPAEDPLHDGELVTRADGTVAIKVRKRKRRSHQPHKEEQRQQRRARMLQVSGALLLLLMAGLAAGSAIVYANSAPFREKLLGMITASSGASAKVELFRVTPSRAIAGRLELAWPAGNVIKELTTRGFSAAIAPASFLGKSISGEEVTANDGTLRLSMPDPGEPLLAGNTLSQPPPIRFRRYAIPKLNVVFGDPATPALVVRESEVSLQPDNANGRPQLLVNRGEIIAPGWHKLKMDRAHIEFRDREIDIVGMRLLQEEDSRGVLELSGSVAPYAGEQESKLAVRMESFLLSGVLGPELGQLISGRVDTVSTPQSNQLAFTPGSGQPATLDLTFRSTLAESIELQGFKFLANLARLLEDNWFERPVFEPDAAGSIRRSGGMVELSNLFFEHKGRMALRGHITANPNRQLSGELKVGISEAMLKAADNRRLDAMFGRTEDGFRWVTLKISGTSTAPADNFLEILEATPAAAAPPPADSVPTFEELTAPE